MRDFCERTTQELPGSVERDRIDFFVMVCHTMEWIPIILQNKIIVVKSTCIDRVVPVTCGQVGKPLMSTANRWPRMVAGEIRPRLGAGDALERGGKGKRDADYDCAGRARPSVNENESRRWRRRRRRRRRLASASRIRIRCVRRKRVGRSRTRDGSRSVHSARLCVTGCDVLSISEGPMVAL